MGVAYMWRPEDIGIFSYPLCLVTLGQGLSLNPKLTVSARLAGQ